MIKHFHVSMAAGVFAAWTGLFATNARWGAASIAFVLALAATIWAARLERRQVQRHYKIDGSLTVWGEFTGDQLAGAVQMAQYTGTNLVLIVTVRQWIQTWWRLTWRAKDRPS